MKKKINTAKRIAGRPKIRKNELKEDARSQGSRHYHETHTTGPAVPDHIMMGECYGSDIKSVDGKMC